MEAQYHRPHYALTKAPVTGWLPLGGLAQVCGETNKVARCDARRHGGVCINNFARHVTGV